MSQTPPTILYRTPREPEAETPPTVPVQAVNRVFTAFTWTILAIVLVVWAVVGAFFWIPLILRSMIRFSVALIQAVLAGGKPVEAARVLRDSVSFYRRGFVAAVEAVTREDVEGEEGDLPSGKRLLGELFWALPVWYLLFLLMGWIEFSPIDLWHWLASVDWYQPVGAVTDWLRG